MYRPSGCNNVIKGWMRMFVRLWRMVCIIVTRIRELLPQAATSSWLDQPKSLPAFRAKASLENESSIIPE